MKILVFGSCNIDTTYGVQHIVQAGESQAATSVSRFPGGKGLNQAIALARAGIPCCFAGCIGRDGAMLKSVMQQDHIDVRYVKESGAMSGQAVIQLDAHGENAILAYPGANGEVTTEYIDQVLSHFEKGDMLLVQNEISNTVYLIDKAAGLGMKIVLNPSPMSGELKRIDLRKVSWMVMNETDAIRWVGADRPYDFLLYATERYKDLQVILTLGKRGSIVLYRGKIYRQFAYTVKAVDVTAAGDTFTGYFLAGMCREEGVETALQYASAAAALTVSAKGAAVSIPRLHEVQEALAFLKPDLMEDSKEKERLLKAYIACNITDVNLKELSLLLGFTVPHTSRWIKKTFGVTLSEYIQNVRCAKAAELLTESNLPVSEIACNVGYQNETFFRTLFLKRYGVLPREYRKAVKQREEAEAEQERA